MMLAVVEIERFLAHSATSERGFGVGERWQFEGHGVLRCGVVAGRM
jgi:hypothetical protein